MGSSIPVRDLAGKIVGLQSSGKEVDPVQATLDASLKAVGATPQSEPTIPLTRPPQWPSPRMIATAVAVLSVGVLVVVFFSSRPTTPPRVQTIPTVLPTAVPTATILPSVVPQANPREVTISPITLYGDYDEGTQIGNAPEGLTCSFVGQSPNNLWAWLECPAPTGRVWAKVADLGLNADQRDKLLDTPVVSRVVPTVPAFSPPSVQGAVPSLPFCADQSSIWGHTHQCATTQEAADALAASEMSRINGTAVAINQHR